MTGASISVDDGEWDLSFEALDIAIPAPVILCERQTDGTLVCHKADPNDLQRKANRFRKGYKNWRRHKPRGARGEVTEIGHKDQGEEGVDHSVAVGGGVGRQSSMSLATVLHQAAEARSSAVFGTSPADATPAPLVSMGSAKGFKSTTPVLQHVSASSLSIPRLVLDEGVMNGDMAWRTKSLSPSHALRRGFKSANQLSEAEMGPEESWLKFYVNPYANLLDDEKYIGPIPLTQKNLGRITKHFSHGVPGKTPTYDRSLEGSLRMCHVGVGGFHRSHQAVYTDDLLELHKEDADKKEKWHICGIGLMHWDRKMYDALRQQDYLYTVLFRSQQGNDARVVGAIMDFVFAPDDYTKLMDTLTDPLTKIVSLTITERGYCLNTENKLDQTEPNIKADLQDLSAPKSAIGMIVAALSERRKRGVPSFTVLSCDNMPENGDTLKELVLEFASLTTTSSASEELATWIESNTTFPNTMVDRITPVTESQHKEILQQDFGVTDEWPVVAEHFGQWIIEDHFVNGERPRWDEVGVMFVPDVKPYEFMKLRLLNGSHSALSYVSYLAGFQFVDDAMNNKQIGDFVFNYMDEVCVSVPSMPGVDLELYKKNLFSRFANPYVKDKVERLMLDGSKKLYNTMKGAILYLVQHKHATTYLGIALAAYIRYVTGLDEQGVDVETKVLDPLAEELRDPARRACGFSPPITGNGDSSSVHINGGDATQEKQYDPREVLRIVFGKDMADVVPIVKDVSRALKLIVEKDITYALLHIN